ncbi:sugar phosphate nucleotidyltransferase [Streptococcus iners]|uniref:Sugar phosphate nucleotidyltransferase n=1 Tax=Streptococcus iners subsp. hyiners TaxID=3028083 RepID=A0AA97A0B6_9STRE|nr:sugar phosphate nucleotidyltransferase [Streptococcus sp. 29892]MCK4029670.1 NTP transferase domain-containing protein [Streptococcus suis]WNY48498.1 sugar phosphate nucleotidyltransferase [Streptococcus sp. 29892]HEL2402213.1 NTP transferase domain-containing protein [Streptococcus suis]HEM4129126.1 NTP transferase domain-containing protein [Streptococcus suis]
MRAIILAAGMGTRLRPLTLTTPKSLIKVGEQTLIERQILFLNEIGISEIIVVTGYLAEKFGFLEKKYGVKLIHNDKYDIYNNFYTMYLVREFLSDAYVIDADNYLHTNFLDAKVTVSTYFSAYKRGFKDEWLLQCDADGMVKEIIIDSGEGTILSGVSYWDEESGQVLNNLFEEAITSKNFRTLYWDDLVKENLEKLKVYKKEISSDDVFEIDNLEDLEKINEFLNLKK